MTDLSLKVERVINAPPDVVFDAWLDPEMLRKFMMPAAGVSVPRASNDPKEGGRFEIIMDTGETELPHAGTYKEISPHERIIFTWESPFSSGDSTVTLTFAPVEAGTHVTLDHVRFADAEARDSHLGGWTRVLDTLVTTLAS